MFQTRHKATLPLLLLVLVFALATSFLFGSVTRAAASSGPDFSISASPTSQTIERGGTAHYGIHIQALNGFNGTVNLTFTGRPNHDSGSISPASVTGTGDATFSMHSAGHQSALGTFTLTVIGTSGSLQHTVQVTYQVTPVPDFRLLSDSFTQTVKPGGSTIYNLRVDTLTGFTQPITLSITGLPAHATASLTVGTVNVPGNSVLTIATTAQTPSGSFTLTVLGTSSTVSHTLDLIFEVIPPNSDFSLSASPRSQTVSISEGVNAVYSIHVAAKNGFIGTVNFTATGAGAPPIDLGFENPNTLGQTVTGSGDIDFLFDPAQTAPGTYTLTITATSGPVQHTITVTVTVVP